MRDLSFWQGIMDTLHGRGQLRLIIQPTMAIILGLRLGISDAKEGEKPFVLRLMTSKGRAKLAKSALRDVIIPFGIAIVLDGVLQYLTLGYVRPMAALVVGAVLIFVPFSISRAFTNRIYRHVHHLDVPHEGAT